MTSERDTPMCGVTEEEAQVWIVRLRWTGDLTPWLDALGTEEWARAAAFHFEDDRRRFVLSHAALRGVLGHHLGCDIGSVPLAPSRAGCPPEIHRRSGAPTLACSLTHAGDTAVIAVSRGLPIGVDIEPERAIAEPDAVARLFAADERLAMAAVPDGDCARAFLVLWTAKEALSKAIGRGLEIPLDLLPVKDVLLRRDQRTLVNTNPGLNTRTAWNIWRLTVPGHIAALAASTDVREVHVRHAPMTAFAPDASSLPHRAG